MPSCPSSLNNQGCKFIPVAMHEHERKWMVFISQNWRICSRRRTLVKDHINILCQIDVDNLWPQVVVDAKIVKHFRRLCVTSAPLEKLKETDQHLLCLLFHILRLGCDVEVLKHVCEELECGPLERVPVPALQHDLVHVRLCDCNFFWVGLWLWI